MGSWYINKIIIDSREKIRGYNAYQHYIDTYNIEVESLKYGDYLFITNDGKRVVFEYKTCEDFITSMENRTLFNELSNQTVYCEYSYLIVAGDFEKTIEDLYFKVSKLRYKYKTKQMMLSRLKKQINGAFNRIYSMYIPIITVDNENDAFDKMLNVTVKIADAKKYGGITRPSPVNLIDNPTRLFLTGIDSIGDKKSENIINTLNIECLDDLCKASLEDFSSVKGLNKECIEEIWKRVHNEDILLK